jgi:hypothetical protein
MHHIVGDEKEEGGLSYIVFSWLFVQVDWFPWGEQAFAKARMEDKPIFLSGSP